MHFNIIIRNTPASRRPTYGTRAQNGTRKDFLGTQHLLLSHSLGAFAKLLKATISFVLSVRPSAWNNSAPTDRIFMKLGI
jgi:hypothetical protein